MSIVRACVVAASVALPGVGLGAIPAYLPVGSYTAPSNSAVYDTTSDGTLIAVTASGQIVKQAAVNASSYSIIGSLPAGTLPSFGAGFARLNPAGTTLAVGDNGAANRVFTLDIADLSALSPTTPSIIPSPNYDAVWTSNTDLYIAGADATSTPSVYRASITSPASTRVVDNIGDGSGGITAIGGRMYTAIGFDVSGARTGEVRSFSLAALNIASAPAEFSSGLLLGAHNTASSLAADAEGNLIVGGFGGVSVVDVSTNLSYLLPGLSSTGFYSAHFNAFTQEILVRDFGAPDILRYAVPSPATGALLTLAGGCVARRRRVTP